MPITTQYVITEDERKMLDNRFDYHAPIGDQSDRYLDIRDHVKYLAHLLLNNCPRSPELIIAIRYLEKVVFFANAAIARNEVEEGGEVCVQ